MSEDDSGETVYATSKEERRPVEETKPDYRDKEWIYTQYVKLGKNSVEISEELGVNKSTILSWMDKYGIERRENGLAQSKNAVGNKKYHDREWLKKKYEDEKLSRRDIAEICGVNDAVIGRWLHNFNIPMRDKTDARKLKHQKENADKKYTDREWLKKKYKDEYLTIEEIAELCDVTPSCIGEWMEKLDISKRTGAESKRIKTDRKYPVAIDNHNKTVTSDDGGNVVLDMSWRDGKPNQNIIYPLADADYLESLYWEEEMSLREIANHIGCTKEIVMQRFDDYDIDTRSISNGMKTKNG